MTFHLETLAAAAFAVSLALVLAFTAMGAFLGEQPGLRRWIQALWLLAGATVLLGLRGAVPDVVPVLAGNGLVCLGNAFTWLGVREFCGRPGRRRASVAGILALFLGVQALFLWGWPSMGIRSLNVIVTSTLWSLATAWTLHRHGPKEVTASTRLVSLLFLADACLGAGFFAAGLLAARPGHEGLLHGMHVAQYFVALVLGPLESFGLAILLSHRLVEELRRTARTDGLTGILTRRTLDAEADKLLRTCRRQGIPCGVLMADLDHFKDFNDAHGHGGGDAALRHFAALTGSQLRPSDLFGRYGGEEFCILLPGADEPTALAAGERLRELLAQQPVAWNGIVIPLTVSVGVASFVPDESKGAEELVAAADRALYRAKRAGRNRVEG